MRYKNERKIRPINIKRNGKYINTKTVMGIINNSGYSNPKCKSIFPIFLGSSVAPLSHSRILFARLCVVLLCVNSLSMWESSEGGSNDPFNVTVTEEAGQFALHSSSTSLCERLIDMV